jgi:hypothetical protein
MPISEDEFVGYYPTLYHMAEPDSWPQIEQYGLLSTSALLDLFEYNGGSRKAIEAMHRPASVVIENKVVGRAVVRDQKPLRPSQLEKCLVGMTNEQWFRLLNSKVFFWPTEERLNTLLNGREYRNKEQLVIEIPTKELFERCTDKIRLSPINSGSVLYDPQKRGKFTFQPIHNYDFLERKKKRGIKNAVAEVTVDYAVPNISTFCNRVVKVKGTDVLEQYV